MIKKGIFTRQVTPATPYGAESWGTKKRKAMVHVVEMHMLRGMCGVSGKDKFWNEDIRGDLQIAPIKEMSRRMLLEIVWASTLKIQNCPSKMY